MTARYLRPISHPGQAETLVHFTGRARQEFAPEVYFLSARDRLTNIIHESRLLARPPYGAQQGVVCLSESDVEGVKALLTERHFEGWGLALRREWVWATGGGPAWYVRGDLWAATRKTDPELQAWMIKTDPGVSEWLHEREWRVPRQDGYLDLDYGCLEALIVSDRAWEPLLTTSTGLHPGTGNPCLVEATSGLVRDVPRWLWTGTDIEVLPPVPVREEFYEL